MGETATPPFPLAASLHLRWKDMKGPLGTRLILCPGCGDRLPVLYLSWFYSDSWPGKHFSKVQTCSKCSLSLFLCFSNALNVNEQRRWLPRRGAWGRIKKDSTNTTTEILRGWIIESKAYSFKYCLLQLTLCIDDSLKATRHSSLLDNWKRMMLCALERKIL